ncbi:hypothetical protein ACFLZO_01330 [Patescibacteria group bacterium]
MLIDLEGMTGIAEFMNRSFWFIVVYGAISFGAAVAFLVYGKGFRPWAAIPALCASVTFTMLASFSTLCAVFVQQGPELYVYALTGWVLAFTSARLCTKATR